MKIIGKVKKLYNKLFKLEAEVRKVQKEINKHNDAVCPNCKAVGKLEYVFDETCYATMDYDEDGCPSCGEVYEQGETNFHHISCSECDTYWESSGDFEDAVQKMKKEQKCTAKAK